MNVVDEHTISFPASDLTPADMYLLLRDSVVPRPIAWVSTVDDEGRTNLAPFSFFNVCSPSPPVLGFSCGPRGDTHNDTRRTLKDTERNIRTTGEFVVNIAPESMLDAMVKSSDALPHGDSEFTHAGIPEAASTIIRPPRISGIPVAYECRCHSITELGTNSWIMGSVVHVHIDRSVYLGEREGRPHRIDLFHAVNTRPVGRLGRAHYVRLRDIETHLRKSGPNV